MNKKIKLSIYLAKSSCTNDLDILKPEFLKEKICSNDNYSIYCNNLPEHPTAWAGFLKSVEGLKPTVSSSRVVLIKKVRIDNEDKVFVLTFGQTSTFFNDGVFVEQFGLKILLNTLDTNQIRQISKRSVGGNQKSTKEQLPRGSNIFEFGFDIQRDLIKAIAGKNDNDESVLGKRMLYGSDLISFSSNYEFENIDSLLKILYLTYKDDKYKNKFDWIDFIQEETSKLKKENLDKELIKQIKDTNPNIWMAVPHEIEWENINGFSIEGDRETIYEDIRLDSVVASLKDELTSTDQLKKREIRAVSANDDNTFIYKWKAYKCIVANIAYNNEEYCISDGKWYKVNGDFVKRINDRYNQIKICDESFIDYNHKDEDEYNNARSKSVPGSIEVHKVGLINIEGRSSMEPCDVFFNKKIIHIKRNGGSSYLSHLFMQASNSAYIWGTAEGRKKLKEKITELDFEKFDKNEYEIVAGIIGKGDSGRPKIPFFSKITACYVADQLELNGFSFSLKNITDLTENKSRQRNKKQ